MGEFVGIVGLPATGKSTSYGQFPELGIEGLDPKETVIINVCGKPLPFRGWKTLYNPDKKITDGGNYIATADPIKIAGVIDHISKNRLEIKNVVLEDGQYTMAFEFMSRAGESGYKKFSDIGVNFNKIRNSVAASRDNLTVFALWHPDVDNEGKMSMKTVGKMVNDYLTPEGLFTVILYTRVSKTEGGIKYQFVTNNDGNLPARSPIGMFKEQYIQNDLGKVARTIKEYYEG